MPTFHPSLYLFIILVREKLNSMNLLLYMAPIAVVLLLPATLVMEENVVGITIALAREDIRIIWYLLFNSALAYFVNLTNFLVTKHTSALTLQVFSIYYIIFFLYLMVYVDCHVAFFHERRKSQTNLTCSIFLHFARRW